MFRSRAVFAASTGIFVSALIFGAACRRDEIVFQPYASTVAALTEDLKGLPEFQNKSLFNFKNLSKDTILEAAGGYKVHLSETDLIFADAAGRAVPCSTCPDLTIEMETAPSSGAIIAKGLHTTDTSGQLLNAAGTLSFLARCQGNSLMLQPQKYIAVTGPDVLPVDRFFLYNAPVVSVGQNFSGWNGTGQEATIIQSSSNPSISGFQTELRQTGWLGVCRFLNKPVKPFYVLLPAEYSADNTKVYFVLKNQVAVAPMTFISGQHFFRYDFAPLDAEAQIVTVSKMQDGWHYARKDVILQHQSSVTIFPKAVSQSDLIKQLNVL